MRKYINPNLYTVTLIGPNGEEIKVKSKKTIDLPEYYHKYVSRGYIKPINTVIKEVKIIDNKPKTPSTPQRLPAMEIRKILAQKRDKAATQKVVKQKQIVGKITHEDGQQIYKSAGIYSISNNIGIGILSYNRPNSLRRLLKSICDHTDLHSTTVIVSDDCSTDQNVMEVLSEYEKKGIIVLRNTANTGIASNTNRLMQCLNRFEYAILLNDDTEVIRSGWEHLFVNAMRSTGLVHLIHHETGVYGASSKGERHEIADKCLWRVDDKPQGAILAYKTSIIDIIGYFDESYGKYGMEHVDWSTKVYENGLQPPGYFSVDKSERFITTHKEESSVVDRINLLKEAKLKYQNRNKQKAHFSDKSLVRGVTYIIPVKVYDRVNSINTVILNIKSQKFPYIDIIVSEHDNSRHILSTAEPFKHIMTPNKNDLFNKSLAFNKGVLVAKTDRIILHDADILVTDQYTQDVYDCLEITSSCHLGSKVIYANKDSTDVINASMKVHEPHIERIVGYFEGGSLACRTDYYWSIGGFNEQFEGYGVEDCEFYARMISRSFMDMRNHVFLHLWHGRTHGWEACHDKNKKLGDSIYSKNVDVRIHEQIQRMRMAGYENINM